MLVDKYGDSVDRICVEAEGYAFEMQSLKGLRQLRLKPFGQRFGKRLRKFGVALVVALRTRPDLLSVMPDPQGDGYYVSSVRYLEAIGVGAINSEALKVLEHAREGLREVQPVVMADVKMQKSTPEIRELILRQIDAEPAKEQYRTLLASALQYEAAASPDMIKSVIDSLVAENVLGMKGEKTSAVIYKL